MINWIAKKVRSKIYYGIRQDIEDEIKDIKKRHVAAACGDLLGELIEAEEDSTLYGPFTWAKIKSLREEIKDSVLTFCLEELKKNEKERIDKFIASEEFIDLIVDRINRKQLERK